MANSKQAKKRIRQTATVNERNRALRSRLRTVIKNTEATIDSGDKSLIPAAFKNAMSFLHKSVRDGIMKKATASRTISRLAARIQGKGEATKAS